MIYHVISIRQPWAELIIAHGKDVENRSWQLPQWLDSKIVLIHASKKWEVVGNLHFWHELEACKKKVLDLGGIVGAAIFSHCPRGITSKWAENGCEHWQVVKAVRLPFHPCKGQLGFFKVDYPFSLPGGWS